MADDGGDITEQNGRYFQRRTWTRADGRWSQIPDLLAQERRLSPNARWAYVLLLSASRRMNGGTSGWVEYPEEWLARDLGATAKSVRGWVRELEEAGFLEIDKVELRGPDGRKTPKLYLVYEPDEVDYMVEVSRSQALNARRARATRQRDSGTNPRSQPEQMAESTPTGIPGDDQSETYRPLRKKEPSPTNNDHSTTANMKPGTDHHFSEPTAEIGATREPENVTTSPATSISEQPLSGSVTDDSCVAIGDRLEIRNDDDTAESDYEEPSDQEMIDRAVTALESSKRLARPGDAERLRSMSVDDLWSLAEQDPDAQYVASQRYRQATFERWVRTTVAMAARYLDAKDES